MFKNLLIPVDGSPNSSSAIRYGIWLAKRFKARLTGIYVVDVVALEGPFFHDLSGSLGFEPYLNFSTKMREILENKGREVLEDFEAECKKEKVSCETELTSGIIINEIAEHSRVADLIIMGKRGINYSFEHGLFGSTTEGVIRKALKPVMVVPQGFEEIKKPLLVYDGSPHAGKAMRSAAEIAKTLRLRLTLLVVAREGGGGSEILSEARDYLAPYRIEFDGVEVVGSPPEEIVRYYEENRHDLLFMGVTSHLRIVEMVLGSTTEYVLRKVNGPVFLER